MTAVRLVFGFLLLCICALVPPGTAIAAPAPWLALGPNGGDARRIAIDPSSHDHLYLGTAVGWLYESRDNGAQWHRLSRVAKRDDLVIDSIVVDPADPRHLTVGAFSLDRVDGGIFYSRDGGQSWTSQAEMRGQSVRSLAAAKSDPHVLVAGTLKGVFRTIDGGLRWKQISPVDSTEIHEVESIAIDPADPNVIYAGTWHLPWKTADGGEHWENIKEGIIDDSDVFSIIIDPSNPSVVYASACSGIYKSVNAGGNFEKVQGIPSTARRTRVLTQDPERADTVFAGTTEGLFRSDDAGKTWSRTTDPDVIVNDVFVDARDSKKVLIATDRGGVLSSEDGGNTFVSSNQGFSARQITSLHDDAQHPATLFIGVVNDKEWGGVFKSENGGVDWAQLSAGLQGRDVFSLGQAPDGTILAGTSHGLFRLDREGAEWKRVADLPDAATPAKVEEPIAVRPPIAIRRNQYAERKADPRGPAPGTAKRRTARAARPSPRTSRPNVRTGSAKSAKASMHQSTPHGPRVTAGRNIPGRGRAPAVAGKPQRVKTAHAVTGRPAPLKASVRPRVEAQATAREPKLVAAREPRYFDGSVSGITTAAQVMLATTSTGLIRSLDSGSTWTVTPASNSADWRFVSAAKSNVVAASLREMFYSGDSGDSWNQVSLPGGITQISAISVTSSGELWVGGREGVFVSADGGSSWATPKGLFVGSVRSLFYDEPTDRMIVAAAHVVFSVQLPQKVVTYADSGWDLRFAHPVGDHLIAATLYDGIVIQPKLMSPPTGLSPASAPASQPSPQAVPLAPLVQAPLVQAPTAQPTVESPK